MIEELRSEAMLIGPNKSDLAGRRRAYRLLADTRGSTFALFSAAIIPLIGFIGMGLDLSRAYLVQSRMQSAVDSAVLAGARTEQSYPGTATNVSTSTTSIMNKFITANLPVSYAGSTRASPVTDKTMDGQEVKIKLTVAGTVPTTLMKVFGFDSLDVGATATAVFGTTLSKAVETMLVLDNTGSMQNNGGMVALRDAVAGTNGFLDIIYGDKSTRDNFGLGMIPYNVIVNVGRLVDPTLIQPVAGYTTGLTASDKMNWKGCVSADPTTVGVSSDYNTIETNTFDMGKTMPNEQNRVGTTPTGGVMPLINPAIYPPIDVQSFSIRNNRYKLGNTVTKENQVANYSLMKAALIKTYGKNICVKSDGSDSSCDTAGTTVKATRLPSYNTWPAPKDYIQGAPGQAYDPVDPASPNYICPVQALPIDYQRTKATYKNYVDVQNVPLSNIGTWHNQAMTWAYRLMQRNDVLKPEFRRTAPPNVPVRRVVVFMTDGNFDSKDDSANQNTAYTGYQSYADRRITLTQTSDAHREQLKRRYLKTCQAMKLDGIEIFTMAFKVEGANAADSRDMFKRCSTNGVTHYFETSDAATLKAAFKTIAADLIDLHLTK